MKTQQGFIGMTALLLPLLVFPSDSATGETNSSATGSRIPASIKAEHEELHDQLAKAVRSGGETGRAAEKVEAALSDHFAKEEAYALPPLGSLVPVSRGTVTPGLAEVVKLSDELEARLPEMLREHAAIKEALNTLTEAATREGKGEAVQFANQLQQHAKTEEEILYPAAILVGKHAKVLLGK